MLGGIAVNVSSPRAALRPGFTAGLRSLVATFHCTRGGFDPGQRWWTALAAGAREHPEL